MSLTFKSAKVICHPALDDFLYDYRIIWSIGQLFKLRSVFHCCIVTGKFTDFPVCVIRSIFIRKLLHLTMSSPFISINQKYA